MCVPMQGSEEGTIGNREEPAAVLPGTESGDNSSKLSKCAKRETILDFTV